MSKTKKKQLKRKTTIIKLGGKYDRTENNSSDDGSDDFIVEKPKRILEKITNTNIDTTTAKNLFNYNNNEILVLIDQHKKAWYRGKDIAVILGYVKPRNAIARHVKPKYKKSYAELDALNQGVSKIDSKTIFITTTGVFQLVNKSHMEEAEKLNEFIAEEVLPTLFTTGSYTLPPTGIDIKELNKSFYDDNYLSDYANKNAIYLAYIGKYKGKYILKYGKTKDFATRDLEQHRKTFNKFNVLKVWETLACDHVEDKIKTDIKACGLDVTMTKKELGINCTSTNIRELIQINEVKNQHEVIKLVNNAIEKTILPKEQKYLDQIKDLKHENEILQLKLNNCEIRLKDKLEIIKLLKEN
jgi:prophage antirepressor-like protein